MDQKSPRLKRKQQHEDPLELADEESSGEESSKEETERTPEAPDKDASASPQADTTANETRLAESYKTSTFIINSVKRKNALTKLIPGYTAPLRLVSSAAPSSKPAGLAALQKKAMQQLQHEQQEKKKAISTSCCNNAVPSFKTGRISKQEKMAQKNATAGPGWFHMVPSTKTETIQKDLQLLRNRNYLDPKRFYKSSDKKTAGIVQVGTVLEGAAEFYSSRLTKKQRRTNLVDEVLADKRLSGYATKKYKTMQQEKTAIAAKRRKRGIKTRR